MCPRSRLVLVGQGTGILRFSGHRKAFIAPALFCLNEREWPVLEQSRELQARALYFHPHLTNCHFTFENIRGDTESMSPTRQRDLHWLQPFLRWDATYDGYIDVGPAIHLRVSSLLDAISYQIIQQEDVHWSCRSVSYLLELLLLLSRFQYTPEAIAQNVPAISLPASDDEVDSVILYLHTHYREKITIAKLTREFHTNRTTLSKRFREVTGMPIVAYLIQLRINLAAAMLRDTGLPISEVRQRVGFSDDSHFRRTFRKYTGASPSEYRRECHQQHGSGWFRPSPAG